MRRVVIAGGHGFLGALVRNHLQREGYACLIVTRKPKTAGDVQWDGKTIGQWKDELNGAVAIVNLTGASIAKKWTDSYKQQILDSRIDPTRVIGQALGQVDDPPGIWINGCAAGFYGDTGDADVDESSPAGKGFLAEICRRWEAAVDEFETPITRKTIVRTASVLGRKGGFLQPLVKLAKCFLGGAHGSGRQWLSWIHEKDFARLIHFLIVESIEGTVNAASPHPVRNGELMAHIRAAVHRPRSPNVPVWALELGGMLGAPDPSLLLMSQRVKPGRVLSEGFEFRFPKSESAVSELIGTDS